jgi:hypothetical protein
LKIYLWYLTKIVKRNQREEMFDPPGNTPIANISVKFVRKYTVWKHTHSIFLKIYLWYLITLRVRWWCFKNFKKDTRNTVVVFLFLF